MKKSLERIAKWLVLLLSDSSQASVRRAIGLIAFIQMMVIINIALFSKTQLANTSLIIGALDLLFALVSVIIVGLTATDVAKIIKNKITNSYDPYISEDQDNTYIPGKQDPFDVENVDVSQPKDDK